MSIVSVNHQAQERHTSHFDFIYLFRGRITVATLRNQCEKNRDCDVGEKDQNYHYSVPPTPTAVSNVTFYETMNIFIALICIVDDVTEHG